MVTSCYHMHARPNWTNDILWLILALLIKATGLFHVISFDVQHHLIICNKDEEKELNDGLFLSFTFISSDSDQCKKKQSCRETSGVAVVMIYINIYLNCGSLRITHTWDGSLFVKLSLALHRTWLIDSPSVYKGHLQHISVLVQWVVARVSPSMSPSSSNE